MLIQFKKMGVDATFVDPDCSEEELEAAFRENTKAVFGESIANPALVVLDFPKNLQVRRTDTEFRLLWIIRLQHRLTAVRLSGEQILLPLYNKIYGWPCGVCRRCDH